MSLINQMLRDLQQRQDGRPSAPPAPPNRRSPRSCRRFRLGGRLRALPPMGWVAAGGVAGVALIVGLSGRLAEFVGPDASLPVPTPPAEMVAIATAPPRAAAKVALTAKRHTPPVPLKVSPPAPPLVYGSNEPADVSSQPAAEPEAAVTPPRPRTPVTASSSTVNGPAPAAGWQQSAYLPTKSPPLPRRLSDSEGTPPTRLHPDLLPGAVNATNLALQKAASDIAIPPPAATPYGQAEAAYRQGRKAYEANRTEVSLEALRRALEFYPGHLPARELLADQYEMAGRTDEVFLLLQEGLAIAPDYTPLRKRMARGLLDRGDAAGAIRALIGNGLPRVEDDPELHRLLAGIYQQLGENFLAAQTYRNLLIDDPQNGPLWVGLGDVLAADGQPGEARKAYRRALVVGGLNQELAKRAGKGSAQR